MPIKQTLRRIASTLACTAAACWSLTGLAADYPTKPITIVVGYAAGGGVDAIARIVAEKLPAALGQPVVVENKPSVAGIVGTAFVAKAKPDAPQDVMPISFVGDAPLILLVNAGNPVKSVQELVGQSKQNPEKANYGASSASFQLINELFQRKTGAQFTHIPYKGTNEAVLAVMSGDVSMTIADAGPASIGLQTGRVKALAVTSAQRLKDYPNVPTLSELGVDLKISLWFGMMAPAGTPPEIIKRLQDEIAKIVAMPDVQKRMTTMSVIPMSNTPDEFAKIIATEIPMWKQIAVDNNIKAN
jgi:tripartite-type tricarboxylate transporter receptor subunit TctC